MPKHITLRELTADERAELERLARSRTGEARLVQRAKIILGLAGGRPSRVATEAGVGRMAVYDWMKRFNANGVPRLADRPRSGRPPTYTAEQRAEVIAPAPKPGRPAGRAKQAADYGRRGKVYIFGAFRPATGEAFTHPYPGRTTANWVDFLGRVEAWLPPSRGRVYAVLDNLAAHRATDVLRVSLAHPRWEFVSSRSTPPT